MAAALAALLPGVATSQCPNGPVFGPLTTFQPFTQEVRGIVTADLDGDGDLDLVAGATALALCVLRNDGPAGFVAQPLIPLPNMAIGICVGDFDGDGRIDVATCGRADVTTTPTRTFQGVVYVLFNTTPASSNTMTFAAPVVLPLGLPSQSGAIGSQIATADLDADGVLDFAVADLNTRNVWILIGQGTGGRPRGTWGTAVPYGVLRGLHLDIEIADFDRDGALDLALLNMGDGTPGVVTLMRGQTGAGGEPLGTFVFVNTVPMATAASGLCVRDLDADGQLDLAVVARPGVVIARGIGPFAFAAPVTTALSYCGDVDVAAADLDGDGRLDLFVPQEVSALTGPNVSVLRDLGAGFVAQGFNFGAGYPRRVALGDFDGDGITDVATGKMSGAITIARGTCGRSGAAVALVTPIGGEAWTVGNQVVIDWFTTANVGAVDVELSRDGGRSWQLLAAGVTQRPLSWRVTPPSTNEALVRVRPSSTSSPTSLSAATFVIRGAGLAMATPSGPGCGAPAPTFRSEVPALGTRVALELRGGLPNALAGFFVSLPTTFGTPIGNGCTVWLDLASMVMLGSGVTDAQGSAAAMLLVPASALLQGATLPAQALVLQSSTALQLSNAVDLAFGL